MLAFCAAENLHCLDVHETLVQHVDEMLIYPDDYHFNPYGNRLVAAAIADFLRQNDLLQARQ
jgi:lysophospholipase L1-like esterase